MAAGFAPVHVGKNHIEQNEIRKDLSGQLQPLNAGIGEENLIADRFQSGLDLVELKRAVFNDENARNLLFHALSSLGRE